MGLPILNFKFLTDRCHRGGNSPCLLQQEEVAGEGLGSPSLFRRCNLLILLK